MISQYSMWKAEIKLFDLFILQLLYAYFKYISFVRLLSCFNTDGVCQSPPPLPPRGNRPHLNNYLANLLTLGHYYEVEVISFIYYLKIVCNIFL